MAPKAKFSQKSRDSSLGRIFDEVVRTDGLGRPVLPPEIDFIESRQGLNIGLYPVQRVLTKALFGTPMDYKEGKVPVWNTMHTELLYTFTETEYLKYVYDQGRCNFGDWRDLPRNGFHTVDAFVGRRGGKSAWVSGVCGAKLRNILAVRDPQDYYNLIAGSRIDFTIIGTDDESSNRLFKAVQVAVNGSSYFEPYLRDNNGSDMQFVTESDRERPDAKPSIQISAFPCTTRAARGPSSIVLALDEFSHFRSSKDANSDDLFISASPSTSQFANPEDPNKIDSITMMISSPWKKLGKMYEVYKEAMDDGLSSHVFTFRCSTAEMNHRIPADALAKEFKQNPEKFPAEFGGEFMDGTGSYIPSIKFDPCIDLDRTVITYKNARLDINAIGRKYFYWVDLGLKNDATGVAIGHLELTEGKGIELIYDYIDRMMVGEKFEGPGVPDAEEMNKCTNMVELQVVDILAWISALCDIYPCHMGGTDQHGGTMLRQNLQILGLNTFEYYHSTLDLNSKMAFSLKGFIDRAAARFPNQPKFITEFQQLEAEWVNKFTLRVQAPNEKNAHDDMSDAVQGVAWLAQKWLDEDGQLDQDPSGKSLQRDTTFLPPAPIANVSAVSMNDLSLAAKIQSMRATMMVPPGIQVDRHLSARPGGRRR
jgi:hypothetical protein